MQKSILTFRAGLFKPFVFFLCFFGAIWFFNNITPAYSQSAKEIVTKANGLLRGKSSNSTAVMEVIKPDWSRKMTTKIWLLEPDYAMILITEPAKDKGTVTLKRERRCGTGSLLFNEL